MRIGRASIILFALSLTLTRTRGAETLERGPQVRIVSPREGAHPQSAYVALSGVAPPRAWLAVSADGAPGGNTQADDSGSWEKVIRAGDGAHWISVRLIGSDSAESVVHVVSQTSGKPPRVEAPYGSLRVADIVLSHSVASEQDGLYSPKFTHAGLFIGGDEEGAPLIAEAVDEAFTDGPALLRMAILEQSLAYTAGHDVQLFRPEAVPGTAQRLATAAWARQVIASGAQFWTTRDFGLLYRAWTLWDRRKGRPLDEARFRRVLDAMDELMNATDRFNCATLVWHAYLEGTGRTVDLAAPNLAFGYPGVPAEVALFFRRLQPHFVTPDILYGSGKLAAVH